MRAITAGVDDALGNALVIEVEHFFAKVEVLEQRRAARARPEGILVVCDGNALLGGQNGRVGASHLVRLAAQAARHFLLTITDIIRVGGVAGLIHC